MPLFTLGPAARHLACQSAAPLVVLLALLGVHGPSVAEAQDQYKRFPLTPTRGTVAFPIPVDEPFWLVFPATPELDSVKVRFLNLRHRRDTAACPTAPGDSAVWRRAAAATSFPVGDSVAIRVAPRTSTSAVLICTVVYARQTAPEQKAFRDTLARAIDREFRGFDERIASSVGPLLVPEDLSKRVACIIGRTVDTARGLQLNAPKLDSVRTAERNRLEARSDSAGAQRLWGVVADGKCGTDGNVPREYIALAIAAEPASGLNLLVIADRQRTRRQQLALIEDTKLPNLDGAFAALDGDADLSALIARYDVTARTSARPFDAAVLTAGQLLRPGASLRMVATGQRPLGPAGPAPTGAQPPWEPWLPTDVDARLTALDSTARALGTVRALAIAGTAADAAVRRRLVARLDAVANGIEGVASTYATLRQALAERQDSIAATVAAVRRDWVRVAGVEGSAFGTFQNRTQRRVMADVGVAWLAGSDRLVAHAGASIYPFHAINKEVPLSEFRFFSADRFVRSIGVVVGVTLSSVKDTATRREGVLGDRSVLLGVGYRVFDAVRFTAGTSFDRTTRAAPATGSTLRNTPFYALSIDFDVRSALGAVADVLK